MCGCVFASMSGLTRSATRARVPCARAIASMRSSSPGRLGVDGLDAERDGPLQLVARLPDAGEDDLVGDEAGAQRDLDLADRVGVGLGAEAAEQAQEGQRRVGLQRVVDGVGHGGERAGRARGTGARWCRRCRRSRACRRPRPTASSGTPSHDSTPSRTWKPMSVMMGRAAGGGLERGGIVRRALTMTPPGRGVTPAGGLTVQRTGCYHPAPAATAFREPHVS